MRLSKKTIFQCVIQATLLYFIIGHAAADDIDVYSPKDLSETKHDILFILDNSSDPDGIYQGKDTILSGAFNSILTNLTDNTARVGLMTFNMPGARVDQPIAELKKKFYPTQPYDSYDTLEFKATANKSELSNGAVVNPYPNTDSSPSLLPTGGNYSTIANARSNATASSSSFPWKKTGGSNVLSAYQFALTGVPSDMKIVSARLQLYSAYVQTGNTVPIKINFSSDVPLKLRAYIEDSGNPSALAALTTAQDITSRSFVENTVEPLISTNTITAASTKTSNSPPIAINTDVTFLLRRILNKANWTSGNKVIFKLGIASSDSPQTTNSNIAICGINAGSTRPKYNTDSTSSTDLSTTNSTINTFTPSCAPSSYSPKLIIQYKKISSAADMNPSATYTVANEATETNNGSYAVQSPIILGQSNTLTPYTQGFRFTGLNIPAGATIDSAKLVATVAQNITPSNLKLSVQLADQNSSDPFRDAEGNAPDKFLTNRSYLSDQPAWELGKNPLAEAAQIKSPELKDLVQQAVCNYTPANPDAEITGSIDWNNQSALVFKIQYLSSSSSSSEQQYRYIPIVPRSIDANQAMKLEVRYRTPGITNAINPQFSEVEKICKTTTALTVKNHLETLTGNYVAADHNNEENPDKSASILNNPITGSPLAESLFEAARYLTGGQVYYGAARERYKPTEAICSNNPLTSAGCTSSARNVGYKQLSNPDSYTGGITPDYRPYSCLKRDAVGSEGINCYGGNGSTELFGQSISPSFLSNKILTYPGVSNTGSTGVAFASSDQWWSSGEPVYTPPSLPGNCSTRDIVIVTDSNISGISSTGKTEINTLAGLNCDTDSDDQSCFLNGLSRWLSSRSIPNTPNKVQVNVIDFGGTESSLLKDITINGKGKYYLTATDDIATVFQKFYNEKIYADTIAGATGSSIGSTLRENNLLIQTYYAPNPPYTRWRGNLKAYPLDPNNNDVLNSDKSSTTVEDANGMKTFSPTSSLWEKFSFTKNNDGTLSKTNATADYSDIKIGGAANQLITLGANRKLFTYIDGDKTYIHEPEMVTINEVTTDKYQLSQNITTALLGIDNIPDSTDDEKTALRNNILQWARGVDLFDSNSNESTSDYRGELADIIHSSPASLIYSDSSDPLDTHSNRTQYAFVGSNDGFLHAFNLSNGKEMFGFIPQEFLPNLTTYYRNDTVDQADPLGSHHVYGVDGSPVAWIQSDKGDGIKSPTENAFVAFGTRRGRNGTDGSYYALDISNISAPTLQWQISRTAQSNSDFAELGQTWSTPKKAKIRLSTSDPSTLTDVLLFGGGYSTEFDGAQSRTTSGADYQTQEERGNAIYMVNAGTGQLLWKASGNTAQSSGKIFARAHMQFPIAADITVIDLNGDGLMDQFYAADLGGQVWRFDLTANYGDVSDARTSITGGVIARLGETTGAANSSFSDGRAFFNAPDIATLPDINGLVVAIGSGLNDHPKNKEVADKFFAFTTPQNAPQNYDPIDISKLVNATDTAANLANPPQNKFGWYIDLDSGEKVVSRSITLNSKTYFSTYISGDEKIDSCSINPGNSRIYTVNLATGESAVTWARGETHLEGQRYRDIKGILGISPAAIIGSQGISIYGGETILLDNFRSFGPGANDPNNIFYWYEGS